MDRNFNQVLLDMRYNLVNSLDSDKISNEETEILIYIDQEILNQIQKEDLR